MKHFRNPPGKVILFLLLAMPAFYSAEQLLLPLKDKSVRFAVIGDSGTGEKPQFEVAHQMADFHKRFPFSRERDGTICKSFVVDVSIPCLPYNPCYSQHRGGSKVL